MKELRLTESDYDVIVNSPGRINITGEHTDYNNGFVLSTAINKKPQFKLRKNGTSGTCNVYSQNLDTSFSFDLEKVEKSQQQWENYILSVIYEIQLTNKLEGFDCVLNSDIPIGSGISSSAALECGLAFGLNELFNLNLSKLTLVELSQRAEHNFVGTKCGIMDQFSSVMSKRDHVILLDCQSLESEYVPIKIEPYKILLLNTNIFDQIKLMRYGMNSRRNFIKKTTIAGAGVSLLPSFTFGMQNSEEKLKVGMIGVGLRGTGHLRNVLLRDDVLVTAICDIDPNRISIALDHIDKAGQKKPVVFGASDYDYRNLLDLQDVDAVIISTPWLWHTRCKSSAKSVLI